MLNVKDYDFICVKSSDLKEPAASEMHSELGGVLGADVDVMFPAFAEAFPLTAQSMKMNWPKPVAAFRYFLRSWQAFLVLQREDVNLFFNLAFVFQALDGQEYEQEHAMLPPKWKELYRWFESFVITADSVKPMGWLNTPFSYSGRLNLNDYGIQIGATKSKVRDFRKHIGSDRLMCWLLTEAGDALFLDEQRCDHKVYHVRGADFGEACILRNPEVILDKYLAHYVSGGSPSDFDFRDKK